MKFSDLRKKRPIVEAPLGDFDTSKMDDMFPPRGKKLFSSPKYAAKLSAAFKKSRVDINVYVISPIHLMELDVIPTEEFGTFSNELHELLGFGKLKPGITFYIIGEGMEIENDLPYTPWMVAHRLAHGMTELGTTEHGKSMLSVFATEIRRMNPATSNVSSLNLLAKNMTMKSARNDSIELGDVLNEFIAQYLITGKVSLTAEILAEVPTLEEFINQFITEKVITPSMNKIFYAR
jgi:hypothetical protein